MNIEGLNEVIFEAVEAAFMIEADAVIAWIPGMLLAARSLKARFFIQFGHLSVGGSQSSSPTSLESPHIGLQVLISFSN